MRARRTRTPDRRLTAAVVKLVQDGCSFEEPDGEAAAALRREIFRRAAAARRAASPSAPFDRDALLAAAARERDTTADAIEAGLYGDRPARQRLLAFAGRPPAAVAAGFELAEAQAVLLRATHVTARVARARRRHVPAPVPDAEVPAPAAGRHSDGEGLATSIALDGPLSLFQGGTRYGLQLGLALPAIAACDVWSIDAEVRWGADRRPLRFRTGGAAVTIAADAAAPSLPDELAAFVDGVRAPRERLARRPRADGAGSAGRRRVRARSRVRARARRRPRPLRAARLLEPRGRLAPRRARARRPPPPDPVRRQQEPCASARRSSTTRRSAALYVFSRVIGAKQVLDRIERLA